MPVESSSASTPGVSTPAVRTSPQAASTFDQRWAATQAHGTTHDRSIRLKLAIAAPIALVIGAASLYLLLAR